MSKWQHCLTKNLFHFVSSSHFSLVIYLCTLLRAQPMKNFNHKEGWNYIGKSTYWFNIWVLKYPFSCRMLWYLTHKTGWQWEGGHYICKRIGGGGAGGGGAVYQTEPMRLAGTVFMYPSTSPWPCHWRIDGHQLNALNTIPFRHTHRSCDTALATRWRYTSYRQCRSHKLIASLRRQFLYNVWTYANETLTTDEQGN